MSSGAVSPHSFHRAFRPEIARFSRPLHSDARRSVLVSSGAVSDPEPSRRLAPIPMRTSRDLPHNSEAEQAVLGALLIEPNAFDLVADRLKAEDFYLHAHQLVFGACAEVAQEKGTIDPVLIEDRLKAKGLL